MTADPSPVLSVTGYGLQYLVGQRHIRVLDAIDISVARGEVVGLVGESGSGKTSLASAIMRFLPRGVIEEGSIKLGDMELTARGRGEMETIRGKRIGMVFQDPGTSLNPTLSLGEQVTEVLVRHQGLTRRQAWAEGIALLGRVGLKEPARMMRRYPHEVSGGEKQRVIIATAFGCRPECILFDEPTTALDVITARQILDLLSELQAETGVASLYISHDLSLVSQITTRVAVIRKGRIVEQGRTERVFSAPHDEYSRQLIAAVPRANKRLVVETAPEHGAGRPLLEVDSVSVTYGRVGLLSRLTGKEDPRVAGNKAVSLSIHAGEILGVVGESGSGKSTLAKALTGLNRFEGRVVFDGRKISGITDMDRAYRRDVQIVFQHPDASLNPRHRIEKILARPLALYGEDRSRAQIRSLLEQVRLSPSYAQRYPHELSGGEKQRVAIARAFASRPRLVICDEITSALDVSVQASVMELLVDLHKEFGSAYMFITHDLNLVRQIAHKIAVMYRGELVEFTEVSGFSSAAHHPYTRDLLSSIPQFGGSPS